jgi:hypothetical protein
MPYDEGLAERIRNVLADQHGVVEKKADEGLPVRRLPRAGKR